MYFNQKIFDLPQKIVWRQTSDKIRAALIGKHWFANTLQAGILKDNTYDARYILGLLNSKFLNFIYLETVKEGGRVFPQVKMGKVRALPFRKIDFFQKSEKSSYERIISLVESMLELHSNCGTAKTPQEKASIERRISATNYQIDQIVYILYNLSPGEIDLVESNLSSLPD